MIYWNVDRAGGEKNVVTTHLTEPGLILNGQQRRILGLDPVLALDVSTIN